MTLNFTRSELIVVINAIAPYLANKGAISLRVEKGLLDLFATAFIEGGSALVRVPCDQTHKPVPWTHVDGTVLQQAIQMADEGVVTLEFAKDKLTLKYPGTVFELRTLTPPITPEKIKFGKTSAHIQGSDLNLLSAMTEAASTEETRPALNGIYIAASKKNLEAAAADGYILSCVTLAAQELTAPGAIYSVKALNRAKRAIKAVEDEEIAIGFGSHSLTLSVQRGNTELTFEIPSISGKFPDYTALVKGAVKEKAVEVETGALNAFLRRATAIQGAVFMQAVNGFLWLLAKNETTGEQCLDSLAIEAKGESAVMLYAHGLLKDTLKACVPNGKVTMIFPKVNKSPMLFEGAASVLAMPLVNPLQESPFKGLQPALI